MTCISYFWTDYIFQIGGLKAFAENINLTVGLLNYPVRVKKKHFCLLQILQEISEYQKTDEKGIMTPVIGNYSIKIFKYKFKNILKYFWNNKKIPRNQFVLEKKCVQ